MSGTVEKFDKRMGRIVSKHNAMSRGYRFVVKKNGLVDVRPKRHVSFPLGTLLAILLIGLLFKGVVLANYGPEKYADRVELLNNGTIVEQAGGWLLEPRLPTQVIASVIGGLIR